MTRHNPQNGQGRDRSPPALRLDTRILGVPPANYPCIPGASAPLRSSDVADPPDGNLSTASTKHTYNSKRNDRLGHTRFRRTARDARWIPGEIRERHHDETCSGGDFHVRPRRCQINFPASERFVRPGRAFSGGVNLCGTGHFSVTKRPWQASDTSRTAEGPA